MMPFDFRIGVLVLGAVLLLGAILGARVLGQLTRTSLGTYVRAGLALAGAALIIWGTASYLRTPAPPRPVTAVAAAPPPPTVDLIGAASAAIADCQLASAPAVPDGATASLKQMTAARSAFQAYDGATNSYVHCVDSAVDQVAQQFAGTYSPEQLQSLKTFGERAHDTAIDQEQAIADQFNGQIHAYKAKHPKS